MRGYHKKILRKIYSIYFIFIVVFAATIYSIFLMYASRNYKNSEDIIIQQLAYELEECFSYSSDITLLFSNNNSILKYIRENNPVNILNAQKELWYISGYLQGTCKTMAIVENTGHCITQDGSMSMAYFEKIHGFQEDELMNIINKNLLEGKNKSAIVITEVEVNERPEYYLLMCFANNITSDKTLVSIMGYDLWEIFKSVTDTIIPGIITININDQSISYNQKDGICILDNVEKSNSNIQISHMENNSNLWGEYSVEFWVTKADYFLQVNSFSKILFLIFVALVFGGIPLALRLVDGICAPLNILSNIVEDNQILLEDKFIMQLLNGLTPRENLEKKINEYHLNEVLFPLSAVVVNVKDYDKLRDKLTLDGLNELHYKLHEYFERAFNGYTYYKILDTEQHSFVIIVSFIGLDELSNKLKALSLGIEGEYHLKLAVCIGKPVYSWEKIHDSYGSALSILDRYVFSHKHHMVVSYMDVTQSNDYFEYPCNFEKNLIDYLCRGETQMIHALIDGLFLQITGNSLVTRKQLQYMVQMLSISIKKLLSNLGKKEDEVFHNSNIYFELSKCCNVEELKDKISFISDELSECVNDIKKEQNEIYIKQIKEYINKHYTDEISLLTLADYLNVSQSYASKIFKNQIGENFKDYLLEFRMNKAIEIMKNNPNMLLGDVAEMVGYRKQTFTRVFIKRFGVSPSVYIKMFMKEEEN